MVDIKNKLIGRYKITEQLTEQGGVVVGGEDVVFDDIPAGEDDVLEVTLDNIQESSEEVQTQNEITNVTITTETNGDDILDISNNDLLWNDKLTDFFDNMDGIIFEEPNDVPPLNTPQQASNLEDLPPPLSVRSSSSNKRKRTPVHHNQPNETGEGNDDEERRRQEDEEEKEKEQHSGGTLANNYSLNTPKINSYSLSLVSPLQSSQQQDDQPV